MIPKSIAGRIAYTLMVVIVCFLEFLGDIVQVIVMDTQIFFEMLLDVWRKNETNLDND